KTDACTVEFRIPDHASTSSRRIKPASTKARSLSLGRGVFIAPKAPARRFLNDSSNADSETSFEADFICSSSRSSAQATEGKPRVATPSSATDNPSNRDSIEAEFPITARCMFSDTACHFALSCSRTNSRYFANKVQTAVSNGVEPWNRRGGRDDFVESFWKG